MPEHLPTSPRLTFRRTHAGDLDEMALLLGDPAVMTYYPRPRTREEAADWIAWNEDNYACDSFGLWILYDYDDGGFVGDCGLTWQSVDGEQHLEIGYHVLPTRQGEGLPTEAPPRAATSPGRVASAGWSRSPTPTTSPHSAWRRRSGSPSRSRRSPPAGADPRPQR